MNKITESTYISYNALKSEIAMFINNSKLNKSDIEILKAGGVGGVVFLAFAGKNAAQITHLLKLIGLNVSMVGGIFIFTLAIPFIAYIINKIKFNKFNENIKEEYEAFIVLVDILKFAIDKVQPTDKTYLYDRAILMEKCLFNFIKD